MGGAQEEWEGGVAGSHGTKEHDLYVCRELARDLALGTQLQSCTS